jgi:hypothetical protein
MTGEPPPVTVFTVELLLRAFADADSAKVLQLWRDGKIRPALNRSLLLRYLRVLRELGLPDRLLRWWAVWLSSPDKVQYVSTEPSGDADWATHYVHVAQTAGAKQIIQGTPGGGGCGAEGCTDSIKWMSAAEFLGRFVSEVKPE